MENFVIASAALAWFLAQAIKTVLALIRRKRFGLVAALTATGGMPSSHSAFVTGLSAGVYHCDGLSLAFVLSVALAILTIRDALGVRKTVDHHAQVLNQLVAAQGPYLADAPQPLPTNAGHLFHEALCGVGVGLIAVVLVMQIPFFVEARHALNH